MDRRRSDFDVNNDSKCSPLLQKTFRVVARRNPAEVAVLAAIERFNRRS
jgi:hypothetical protein